MKLLNRSARLTLAERYSNRRFLVTYKHNPINDTYPRYATGRFLKSYDPTIENTIRKTYTQKQVIATLTLILTPTQTPILTHKHRTVTILKLLILRKLGLANPNPNPNPYPNNSHLSRTLNLTLTLNLTRISEYSSRLSRNSSVGVHGYFTLTLTLTLTQ